MVYSDEEGKCSAKDIQEKYSTPLPAERMFKSMTYRKMFGLVIYKEYVRPSDIKGKCSA
jgi:hypothetical protein